MGLLEKAKKLISAKWFSFGASAVTAQAFVVGQGVPCTATRPIGFAPDGFYIEDLGFFFSPGQSQDMGALFTQRQLNESIDFKCALVNGDLVCTAVGTIPISDPVTVSTSITFVPPADIIFDTEVTTINAAGFAVFIDVRIQKFDVSNWKQKTLVIVNSGTEDVQIRGWISIDGGTNYPVPHLTTVTLVPGGVIMVAEDMAMTHFRFDVKRGTADGEVTTYGYAYRV